MIIKDNGYSNEELKAMSLEELLTINKSKVWYNWEMPEYEAFDKEFCDRVFLVGQQLKALEDSKKHQA